MVLDIVQFGFTVNIMHSNLRFQERRQISKLDYYYHIIIVVVVIISNIIVKLKIVASYMRTF